MKTKITIVILIVFLCSFCTGSQDSKNIEALASLGALSVPSVQAVVVPDSVPVPEIPTPTTGIVLWSVIKPDSVQFYDEFDNLSVYASPIAYVCEKTMISVNDIMYVIDNYGATISSMQLPAIAAAVEFSGADFYTLKTISPADALAAGALYRPYTTIYKNYSVNSAWINNQWQIKNLVKTDSGDLVAVPITGAMQHISGTEQNIFLAEENGLFIYDYDNVLKVAKIKTGSINSISWTTNDFGNAKFWQNVNGEWISNNGYSFTESGGMIFNDTALQNFNALPFPVTIPNGETPTVLSAGIRVENSEDVSYWIEANTGTLFRYVSSIDSLQEKYSLYLGDGLKATGTSNRDNLNPIIYENYLYYSYDGRITKINLDTGVVSIFISQNAKLYLMR